MVGLAVGALFLLWFYRAASTGWVSGLPARRRPMLATLSFVIPVLNLWWPYQAMLDMVPAEDPRRVVIRWWWVLWLSGTSVGSADLPGRRLRDRDRGAGRVDRRAPPRCSGAAIAARAVVEYVTSTHEHLAGSATAAS